MATVYLWVPNIEETVTAHFADFSVLGVSSSMGLRVGLSIFFSIIM